MKKLTQRQADLILEGMRITGSASEGFDYSYERFYITDPIDELIAFCKFVDVEVGGCGRANIHKLHEAWRKNDQEYILGLAELIRRIHSY